LYRSTFIPISSPNQSPISSPPNNPINRISSDMRFNKSPIFTGKDLSLIIVNIWIIYIEDYIDDIDNESHKIKIVGSFLIEIAEL
jgi:hypothetical protein